MEIRICLIKNKILRCAQVSLPYQHIYLHEAGVLQAAPCIYSAWASCDNSVACKRILQNTTVMNAIQTQHFQLIIHSAYG
jgi:hypothetical protein